MPTIRTRTVTELKPIADARVDVQVGVETTAVARDRRPHGKRFGALVHAVLANVDLRADAASVLQVTSVQGRMLGAAACETEAAAEAVLNALQSPLIRRAAASAECRRETPVVLMLGDADIVEGIVDLAFREHRTQGAAWTVVDFKTDVELGARRADYERQVVLYSRAIAAATGEPVEAAVLLIV